MINGVAFGYSYKCLNSSVNFINILKAVFGFCMQEFFEASLCLPVCVCNFFVEWKVVHKLLFVKEFSLNFVNPARFN